uniref:Putative ovule protein n=1 Tax=Solanum chacoense TaxID=4108 RepID=A0A0V0GY63_SOLCH
MILNKCTLDLSNIKLMMGCLAHIRDVRSLILPPFQFVCLISFLVRLKRMPFSYFDKSLLSTST